jgi:diphosphomevalonate decarboxylase
MQATAIAQPNIALIKYWGKRDIDRNLPAVGSISITLSDLQTEVSIELSDELSADVLFVNDDENHAMLPRISACLDKVLGKNRLRACTRSRSNFPIAAGLASSAAAFAATTVAAAGAANLSLGTEELSQLAGASIKRASTPRHSPAA